MEVAAKGDLVYSADSQHGLEVIDVVADNFDGVKVLNVDDPTAPYEISEYRRVKAAHEYQEIGGQDDTCESVH